MPLLDRLPEQRPPFVLADVDDTLAASTQAITPPMAKALTALVEAGCGLVFVSGGSVPQLKKQVSAQLTAPHVLLGTSGAHAVRMAAGSGPERESELFKLAFSAKDRAEILVALQALVERYQVKPDTDTEDQLQDRGTQFTLSALGRHAPEARKRAFDPDGSRRREWVSFLVELLGDERFSIRAGGTTSVDITPKGVDKGTGLLRLMPLLGGETFDGLYFGDRFEEMGNDRPVMEVMDCIAVKSPAETLAHLNALLALPPRKV